MSLSRRAFLTNSVLAALAATMLPKLSFAQWEDALKNKTQDDILTQLFNTKDVVVSDKITITAPEIAENGRVVPIEVQSELAGIKSITLIAEKNPTPLIAQFNFADNFAGHVASRIKMGATGDVVAVVQVGDQLHIAKQTVQITEGGCGG